MGHTFIIAEAGVNHNGSFENAVKLIDIALECSADAIKFQTFKAHETTGAFADKAKYQKENLPGDENQYEMIKKLELPFEAFKELQSYCKSKGIIFISTPDGIESLDYLVSLHVPIIKIGSTEVTNIEFLKLVGEKGIPVILSTGMATLGEVESALNAVKSNKDAQVSLMHCTTDYPTLIDDVNLKAMLTMKDAFKVSVGYSDHTLGMEAAVAAVALGAEMIEKHITIDRNMEGPDHKASMPPNEFKKYVSSIRDTEKLLGDGIKKPTEKEKIIMRDVRRSIVAACDLKEGTILTKELLSFKRPGYGIKPDMINIFEGRILKRNLLKDELVKWNDI